MNLQEQISRIKDQMGLIESEDDDFVEKYEKNLEISKKIAPELIKVFKSYFGDDLYKIKHGLKSVAFGSTSVKDKETGEMVIFSPERVVFSLEFITKTPNEKRQIRHKVFDIIDSYTPFNMTQYGSPIDVELYNYYRENF
jgi:hypothetical protein